MDDPDRFFEAVTNIYEEELKEIINKVD